MNVFGFVLMVKSFYFDTYISLLTTLFIQKEILTCYVQYNLNLIYIM